VNKEFLDKQVIAQMLKPPKKDKGNEMPHFYNPTPNHTHQADLLFMPNDNGYKYALVVVDIYDRKVDAEPLKKKQSDAVLKAFKKIYQRKIIKIPLRLEVDAGSEFKGSVKRYFTDREINLRVAKTGRHRQQAVVERKNQQIAKALFTRMSAQELLTGTVSKEWIADLPVIIRALNKKAHHKKLPDKPIINKNTEILKSGTKVRVALDNPKNFTDDKRLPGRFRTTDIRFDEEIREIDTPVIQAGYPIM
jgi:hypothetical protein